jgi:hypothetical protein
VRRGDGPDGPAVNARVDGDEVATLVRTQAPPPGLEPFAAALATIAQAPTVAFGVAVDPMRPADVMMPPGFSSAVPPHCPTCFTLLHPIANNHAGDALFECLYDGYEAVYRAVGKFYEPRPQRPSEGWTAPLLGIKHEEAVPAPTKPLAILPLQPDQPAAPAQTAPVSNESQWLLLADASLITGKSNTDLYKMARTGGIASRKDAKGRLEVDVAGLVGA